MKSPTSIDAARTVPPPPDGPWSEGEITLRFEDIAQDGRLLVPSLLTGLTIPWQALMREPYTKPMLGSGVLPILTRVVAEGCGGPFAVDDPMHVRATYGFSHVRDAGGAVDRIHLGMWIEASMPIGVTYGAPPEGAGTPTTAGRVYVEHTFTRPFAPPGDRRVTRLDVAGLPPVPGPSVERFVAKEVARPPHGATLHDATMVRDAAPIVFGLAHTDSNQHVNSLVYARFFEEAALRRIAEIDRAQQRSMRPRLVRRIELGYRKPCFAGEAVGVVLRAFEHAGQWGAFGAFVPADTIDPDDLSHAHAFVACSFAD